MIIAINQKTIWNIYIYLLYLLNNKEYIDMNTLTDYQNMTRAERLKGVDIA